jgi:hypothetical protein
MARLSLELRFSHAGRRAARGLVPTFNLDLPGPTRSDAAQWDEAYASLFPPYQLLIESQAPPAERVAR